MAFQCDATGNSQSLRLPLITASNYRGHVEVMAHCNFQLHFAVPFHPVYSQVNSWLLVLMKERDGRHNQNQQITANLTIGNRPHFLPHQTLCRTLTMKQNLIMSPLFSA